MLLAVCVCVCVRTCRRLAFSFGSEKPVLSFSLEINQRRRGGRGCDEGALAVPTTTFTSKPKKKRQQTPSDASRGRSEQMPKLGTRHDDNLPRTNQEATTRISKQSGNFCFQAGFTNSIPATSQLNTRQLDDITQSKQSHKHNHHYCNHKNDACCSVTAYRLSTMMLPISVQRSQEALRLTERTNDNNNNNNGGDDNNDNNNNNVPSCPSKQPWHNKENDARMRREMIMRV